MSNSETEPVLWFKPDQGMHAWSWLVSRLLLKSSTDTPDVHRSVREVLLENIALWALTLREDRLIESCPTLETADVLEHSEEEAAQRRDRTREQL